MHDHPQTSAPEPPPIEPAVDAPAHQTADELLSHGLLGYLHRDNTAVQERRVARVLDAIEIESASHPRRAVVNVMTWRTWGALAATIAIVGALAIFGVPGETSGLATVQKSIAAMQQGPGDRRFEIRTQGWNETEVAAEVRGTVDTRTPNLVLLKIPGGDGRTVIVGSDESGRWAIRPDGEIERTRVEQAWPRFATIGDESIFADSVDKILEQAARFYDLSPQPAEKLDGHGDRALEHVRGLEKRTGRPGPAAIDVWINPDSRIAERLQFSWDRPPEDLDIGPNRPAPPGPRRRPDLGPEGEGNPPPPRGEMRDEPGDDRRPNRPRPARPGNPLGPPQDGPRGNLDGDDRPHPRPLGPGGPFSGPRPRPGGPGAGPGPGGDGVGGPRPSGPPHKVLRLDRVEPPAFAPDWFKPETHAGE